LNELRLLDVIEQRIIDQRTFILEKRVFPPGDKMNIDAVNVPPCCACSRIPEVHAFLAIMNAQAVRFREEGIPLVRPALPNQRSC